MHISLVMASSVDGRITRGKEASYLWASPEDQQFFADLKQQHNLIVMGRKTYQEAKPVLKLDPAILRVVMTHEPENFSSEEVPGQLEFSAETPVQLIKRLADEGYTEMLLVGGSQLAAAFLTKKLIDTIWLTIEPMFFGVGVPLFSHESPLDVNLCLEELRQLNDQGTILLKYSVKK
jgi:dihydrofolate reductase